MKFVPETIGDALRMFVRSNYRSSKDAARDFGMSQSYLSAILAGVRKPTDTMLRKAGFALSYVPASKLDGECFPYERREGTQDEKSTTHVAARP